MSCLGLVCCPATGHLNPLIAVGRRLMQRGHQVTVFQIADAEAAIRVAGLDFRQIGVHDAPLGTIRRQNTALSALKGLAAYRLAMQQMRSNARRVLRDAPGAMRALNIEAVVGDAAEGACGTVAEYLEVPFLTLVFSPPIVFDHSVPPFIFGWRHRPGRLAGLRNLIGYELFFWFSSSVLREINSKRVEWGLRPLPSQDWLSTLGQITQLPRALEFPGAPTPRNLRYAGPFHDGEGRRQVDFPWERLNGKPLVYASMGTISNGIDRAFRLIAEACNNFDVQVVLSLGGNLDPEQVGPLAGSPLVVRYAPQLELMRRAAVTITHAGMNTTLESLAQGVPLVAIPVTADQPGVAARIAASGSGAVVPFQKLTFDRLRIAIGKVLEDPSYRAAARRIQMEIRKCDGLGIAADAIEQAVGIVGNGATVDGCAAAVEPRED